MEEWGTLYGIGIGPGDTELLTLKAVKTLNAVDVIFSPRSAPKRESIARKIVEPILEGKAELKELIFPMTRDKEELERHWALAAEEVAGTLKAGKDAAFITLGDPFFYSTYIYLYRRIREYHPQARVVTMPGISSVFASASAAGVPLAIGDERIAILPLPQVVGEIWHYLEMFDTVVILKVGERLKTLVDVLKGLGLAENAVLVQKVSQQGDEVVVHGLTDLSDEELERVGYLSTVIVKRELEY